MDKADRRRRKQLGSVEENVGVHCSELLTVKQTWVSSAIDGLDARVGR